MAFAQFDARIYGVADVYLQAAKGDRASIGVQSGGMSGSRLGLKGSEDLAGGMKALFQIETGIDYDTGSQTDPAVFWARQAYVGLSGKTGVVTLGRQYVPHLVSIDSVDPFETGAGSSQVNGIVSVLAERADNAFVYASPKLGAFNVTLMNAFGENATGRLLDVNVRYTGRQLVMGLDVVRKRAFGSSPTAASIILLTGSYDAGSIKIMGGIQAVRNLAQAADTRSERIDLFGGVRMPIGSAHLSAGFGTGSTRHVGGSRATQFSLGYEVHASKRTDLYAVATCINNSTSTAATADAATGLGPPASTGHDVQALILGIRHRF